MRMTWNTQRHGIYAPGLLIWGAVLAEIVVVVCMGLYALCRFAMWVGL